MSRRLKILIVGGYGTFGGRIVQLLETNPDLTLIVAGRSMTRARAFCQQRTPAAAELTPAAFDRDGDARAQLVRHEPDILIDASGPFQAYGERSYPLVEACIEARVNYLDLADGSDFVAGIGGFDARAKSAGVYVLSGVSSFPVLTAAVVRRLSRGMARVKSIRGGIAPSPYAGVGENVIRAIASYAGQPIALKKAGRRVAAHPLTEAMRYTVSPPGRTPLRNTLFSLMDVPDLRALGDLWPEAADIWMGAGPVPEVLHRLLIGLSWLVRWKLVATLTPIARLMHWVTNHVRWGEHRGGMFVEVVGEDEKGSSAKRSWHLLAEGDDGPLIPAMAVAAILRRVLAGRAPGSGARAATRDLELEDYEALFLGRTIFTGLRDDTRSHDGLYRRILGSAYDRLPRQIRDLHETPAAVGEASVERGQGRLANWVAEIAGFPRAAPRTPVRLTFDRSGGKECWSRAFGASRFQSEQLVGTNRSERLLVERFGRLDFSIALVVEGSTLSFQLRRWAMFGMPLPMGLAPNAVASETVDDDEVFRFDVEIRHRFTGLIVRYRGWLKPEAALAETRMPPSSAAAIEKA